MWALGADINKIAAPEIHKQYLVVQYILHIDEFK